MTVCMNKNLFKNAMGTVFLLAAAFFVCSTFVSMRSVFADPITPENTEVQQSSRISHRNSSRTSRRSSAARTNHAVVARTASNNGVVNGAETANVARSTGSSRSMSSRAATRTNARAKSTRSVASRANTATENARSVTSRATATRNTTNSRNVRARTATTTSRVGVNGSVSAGARASASTSYSYLTSKLYTGNYSNIIDSTTGLISAEAYSNCLESYYTCMDEICTARSDTKGRCSCAGRATNFLQAEEALESANEELIKLSGQLSLLIATKGKGEELASAFSLTDAEKVMNCAAYVEVVATGDDEEIEEWCNNHVSYDSSNSSTSSVTTSKCSKTQAPSYCSEVSSTYNFKLSDLNGSGSDILAQLKSWASAKDYAKKYTVDDSTSLVSSYSNISDAVNSMIKTGSSASTDTDLDSLANKWGYELFEYAHNNVCGRVLDSCFNGIYEGCGTPPSVTDSEGHSYKKCTNGSSSSCPFNYNSYISVDSASGEVKLNERLSGSSTSSNSASCFGYTTTTSTTGYTSSTDPYSSLRGPVADARRGIMQKYLLDANAACDVYGDALKETAQNINYQKIAAEESLKTKRLAFMQEEKETRLSEATAAMDNFNNCISEIWDCYQEYEDEDNYTTARIKSLCSTASMVPSCFETMICSPAQTQFSAVIDRTDDTQCKFTDDYSTNTCRNVVTISEILYGASSSPMSVTGNDTYDSKAIRESCLQKALNCDSASTEEGCLRNWKKSGSITCKAGYYLPAEGRTCQKCLEGSYCLGATCTTNSASDCGIKQCDTGFTSEAGASSKSGCVALEDAD